MVVEVVRTLGPACALLRGRYRVGSLDLETSGLRPYHDHIVVLSIGLWGEEGAAQFIVLHWPGGIERVPPELARALEEADLLWHWHNGAAFDALFLGAAGVDVSTMRSIDTLVSAQVLLGGVQFDLRGNRVSAGLDQELRRRLDITLPGKKGKQRQAWIKKHELDQDDLDYCIADIAYLPALSAAQWEQATHHHPAGEQPCDKSDISDQSGTMPACPVPVPTVSPFRRATAAPPQDPATVETHSTERSTRMFLCFRPRSRDRA